MRRSTRKRINLSFVYDYVLFTASAWLTAISGLEVLSRGSSDDGIDLFISLLLGAYATMDFPFGNSGSFWVK